MADVAASLPAEMQNISEDRIVVVFRNDDPSAKSNLDHEREIFAIFERYGVPQTLGVIPAESLTDLHDPSGAGEEILLADSAHANFLKDYALRTGSEIALHGYNHRTNLYSLPRTKDYFEFNNLPLSEQERRIATGTRILEKALGIRPVTFIPPWNGLDQNTVIVCARNGYKVISAAPYVPSQDGILSFGANTDLASFEETFAEALKTERRVFLNINFHSRTIRTKEEKAHLEKVVKMVSQHPACKVQTVASAAAQFPEELKRLNQASFNLVPLHVVPGGMRPKTWAYFRIYQWINKKNRLGALWEDAQRYYWRGDYEACSGLTSAIDDECRKTTWMARVVGLGIGCAAGALAAGPHAMNWLTSFPLKELVALSVLAVGWSASRRVITCSCRRELVALTILAALSVYGTATAIEHFGKLLRS